MKSSRIKGFYKLKRGERLDALREFADIPSDQLRVFSQDSALTFETTDLFVENAVGSYPLPLGVATSFKINGEDYLIPMAVEESSVIAASSNAARIVYEAGGFQSKCLSSLMIGQIQLLDLPLEKWKECVDNITANKQFLIETANAVHPRLLMRGGGVQDIEVHTNNNSEKPFIVVHILIDTRDAMGANIINTVCEKLAPHLQDITGARIGLKILSNLADRKLFQATCRIDPKFLMSSDLTGAIAPEEIAQRVWEAFVFADNDPYRAATHNKGIMNGVDPVVIVTGNDWRAIEAGAHAYAAKTGRYRSLSRWQVDSKGFLVGELTIPLQLGTVGGVTRLHPSARIALQILGNPTAEELGKIIACSGLAANLAALRALCTTGIQKGHMRLHAKNIAFAAGAQGAEVEIIADLLIQRKQINASEAEMALREYRERERQKREPYLSHTNPS
ncbi:MAG: hydroxymethylglutaryl-CoA reductase, degradative [bacterium]